VAILQQYQSAIEQDCCKSIPSISALMPAFILPPVTLPPAQTICRFGLELCVYKLAV